MTLLLFQSCGLQFVDSQMQQSPKTYDLKKKMVMFVNRKFIERLEISGVEVLKIFPQVL